MHFFRVESVTFDVLDIIDDVDCAGEKAEYDECRHGLE